MMLILIMSDHSQMINEYWSSCSSHFLFTMVRFYLPCYIKLLNNINWI
jgi:hypothetical protein